MKSVDVIGKSVRMVLIVTFLTGFLFSAGCAGYRKVKEIRESPADQGAVIRVIVNTSSQGKILQDEIDKGVWRLPGGAPKARPSGNYEWYLWMGIDDVVYPLIPKDRSFINNISLIHVGENADLTLEYPVPTDVHRYLLGFAGKRPYVYSQGFGSGEGDSESEVQSRLGVTWKQCFSARLKSGEVLEIKIDDEGVHLPENIETESLSNCNQWLFGLM